MSRLKDNAMPAIFDYLMKQNRPYSVVDIFNNLHKEYGKSVVTKALEQLVQDDKIMEKTYGKQKIYFAKQKLFPDIPDDELRTMDAEINNLTVTLNDINQAVKTNEAVLSSLNSSLTTEEIKSKIAKLKEETCSLEKKLESLKSNTSSVTPEERDKIRRLNEMYVKEWRRRKRTASEMLDAIMEGYPKGKKILLNEIGVETDEDVNVKPP